MNTEKTIEMQTEFKAARAMSRFNPFGPVALQVTDEANGATTFTLVDRDGTVLVSETTTVAPTAQFWCNGWDVTLIDTDDDSPEGPGRLEVADGDEIADWWRCADVATVRVTRTEELVRAVTVLDAQGTELVQVSYHYPDDVDQDHEVVTVAEFCAERGLIPGDELPQTVSDTRTWECRRASFWV